MTPPWGINWQRYHADRDDMPHIAKMGYRSFTIYEWMWSNRDFCNELLSVARKDAIFLDRDHPLSEQKDDLWKSDPARKGRNHADEWAAKVKDGKVFTPLDRTYFLGLNEPNSEMFQREIDAYNEAFCRRMTEHGLRAAAYSFGVGHPSTVDLKPENPVDWSWYAASAAAILEGHHLAAFHEYGAPVQGGYGWEFWCNRLAACPYAFDAGLDECGIDNGVVDSGQLYGYAKFMPAEQYLLWLDGFQTGMAERAHTRKVNLLFYNIFGFDHGSSDKKDWHSFDIRPMRKQLEAFVWTAVATPPSLPPIAQPPAPIETLLPVIEKPAPAQPPQGDNWARSRAYVAKWEGDFQDFDWDIGNWTGCEVGKGEKKGTKYGISACSYPTLDIRNITMEQADAIYFRDYWQKSGADKLPWPYCLVVFDTAVLHGVGAAQAWVAEYGDNLNAFVGRRLRVYTKSQAWAEAGRGWVNRVADLMLEASK